MARLISIALLAVALAVGWCPALQMLSERWQEPQYSHGWLVPALAAGVAWSRRSLLDVRRCGPAGWGVVLLAAAFVVEALGELWSIEPLQSLSILLAVAGVCGTVGGTAQLRWAAPSIAVLAFMLPLPYRVESALSMRLQETATQASAFVLQMLGCAATSQGTLLVVDGTQLGVAEACSGLRMLTVLLALGAALAAGSRRPAMERVAIAVMAAPLAVVVNVLRIVATALVYRQTSDAKVLERCHDVAGWLMPVMALVLMGVVLRALDWVRGFAGMIPTTNAKLERACSHVRSFGPGRATPAASARNARPIAGVVIVSAAALLIGLGAAARTRFLPAQDPAALAAAASRLQHVPAKIGEWIGSDETVDAESLRIAGATDSLARRYVRPRTGDVVTMIILCGPPGPIAAHLPTACYRGLGYSLVEGPHPMTFGGLDHFAVGRFAPSDRSSGGVETAWAWSVDGKWDAPAIPRVTFARAPALYKLYLAVDANGRGGTALVEFGGALTEVLREVVFELP